MQIFNGEVPDRLSKMTKICEISADMRPEVCQFCWRKTFYPYEIEEERWLNRIQMSRRLRKKISKKWFMMFISEEVPIGDDREYDNEGLNTDDNVEWVKWVDFPEEVPEKRKVQKKISDYFTVFEK